MHELHGFLVIDKPAGISSHDVVFRVRRAAGGRVGHAGTLDPFATGVLVVCVGKATRLAEWAAGADKRYLAEVELGVETDTYDPTGRVLATRPVGADRAAVEAALAGFRGEIDQRPPMFSAVQVDGQRLYDLARRGRTVEVEARRVNILRLDLVDWQPPRLTLDLTCSKGTYVRSLAHDLGAALETGAHLAALRRLASGDFTVEQAVALDEAVALIQAGQAEAILRPMESGVAELPRVDLDRDRLRNGLPAEGPERSSPARVHSPDGGLFAIVDWRDGQWWPRKVLA